jgi:hypothetical protein
MMEIFAYPHHFNYAKHLELALYWSDVTTIELAHLHGHQNDQQSWCMFLS